RNRPRRSERELRGEYGLGTNSTQWFGGISVDRWRSGWGQVRCPVILSAADQADSHEFENRPTDRNHRYSTVTQPGIGADGCDIGEKLQRQCRAGNGAEGSSGDAVLRQADRPAVA